jgi:thioredoxin reductase
MAENEVYDFVIVGGGPGGLSAGIYAMCAALAAAHWVERKKAGAAGPTPGK